MLKYFPQSPDIAKCVVATNKLDWSYSFYEIQKFVSNLTKKPVKLQIILIKYKKKYKW